MSPLAENHARSPHVPAAESEDAFSLWAFRSLLFYLVIAFVQPQNRFVFLWPLHIADISFALAVGLHVLACLRNGRPFVRFGVATFLSLALLFFAFLSQYAGRFQISSAWNPYIDIICKNATLAILLEAMLTTPKRVWVAQMVILLSTLWWMKSGLSLVHSGASYGSAGRFAGGSISLIENPNSFAYMLCVHLPLYLYFFQCAKSKWERLAGIALALSAIFLVFKTGSRTGMVTLVPLGIFLLPEYLKKHRRGLIATIVAIVVLFPMTGEQNMARFRTIPAQIRHYLHKEPGSNEPVKPMTQDEQSAEERKGKNRDTWALVKKYPFFGVGVWPDDQKFREDFPMAGGEVHCETLMAGRQMGFIGIFIYWGYLSLLYFGGWVVRCRMRDWPAAAALGRVFQLQALVFAIGGSFCPSAWNIPMLIAATCASALAGLSKSMTDEPFLPIHLVGGTPAGIQAHDSPRSKD
jgi:hypothetical protein